MKITLCGSSRFEKHFKIWDEFLSLAGHVVYTLSVYPSDKQGVKNWYNAQDKRTLDKVHKMKIENSEAILLLNVCAYIGESTFSEVEFAKENKKTVYALESWGIGCGIGHAVKVGYGIPLDYTSPIDTSGFRSVWDARIFGSANDLRSRIVDQYHKFELREKHSAFDPTVGWIP